MSFKNILIFFVFLIFILFGMNKVLIKCNLFFNFGLISLLFCVWVDFNIGESGIFLSFDWHSFSKLQLNLNFYYYIYI